MAEIDAVRKDAELLVKLIVKNIKEEFAIKHLSGNLARTIKVYRTGDNEFAIHIPAQTYNMLEFQKHGVVIYNGQGSYASKIDNQGSQFLIYPQEGRKGSFRIYPGNHQGYINKVINRSIMELTSLSQSRVLKVEDTK